MRALLRAIPQRLIAPFLPSTRHAHGIGGNDISPSEANLNRLHAAHDRRAGGARVTRMTACLLLPVAAAAYMGSAHGATEEEQSKACKADAIRLCSEDIPSKEKITACMQRKVKQLSPGCRAMFKK